MATASPLNTRNPLELGGVDELLLNYTHLSKEQLLKFRTVLRDAEQQAADLQHPSKVTSELEAYDENWSRAHRHDQSEARADIAGEAEQVEPNPPAGVV